MVLVVNMIPRALSGETNQDSEPHLAVNPANPLQIVATAFTPDPMGGANAPVYVSLDGGTTWVLNFVVPSIAGSALGTSDITTAFGTSTNTLYGGILKAVSGNPMVILRSPNFGGATAMRALSNRNGPDQPFAHAVTINSGANAGKDVLLIGDNDLAEPTRRTATVDISTNANGAAPRFKSVRIEARSTGNQNGPQVRPVAHPDGTLYAAFYSWRGRKQSPGSPNLLINADVVVVRDDKLARGAKPFQALVDPTDGIAGMRVAQGVQFPFEKQATLGQQRIGGALSIAVDPRNSSTVYLAWADTQPSGYTIHVRRSTDRGVTWSTADLLSIAPHSTNPALAVNSEGTVGLLYQQLTNASSTPANQRWVTHFTSSTDTHNWNDLILAKVPAATPIKKFDPYLGDFDHVLAIGKDFYGIFSANNTPDKDNFPNGVLYQRNCNFEHHTLLGLDGTTLVAPSIDPFFFKVDG